MYIMALYAALVAFNGKDYNGLRGHEGAVRSIAFVGNTNAFYSSRQRRQDPAMGLVRFKILPDPDR